MNQLRGVRIEFGLVLEGPVSGSGRSWLLVCVALARQDGLLRGLVEL